VFVLQDAVPVVNESISAVAAVGSYNVPFALIAGVNSVITVCGYISNPVDGTDIAFSATLTPA